MMTATLSSALASIIPHSNASPSALLSAIPVLDWRGPEFLAFYLAALVVAWLWTRQRIRSAQSRFELPQPPPVLTDPYEIAFLDGGARRVQELVVLRLVKMGLVTYNPGQPPKLVTTGSEVPSGLTPLETAILDRIEAHGDGGWPLDVLAKVCNEFIPSIEKRLAALGLRPAPEDLRKIGTAGPLLPFTLLLVLGAAKAIIGFTRDRPVFFLLCLLGLTLIIRKAMEGRLRRPFVTVAGKRALKALRQSHPQPPSLEPEENDDYPRRSAFSSGGDSSATSISFTGPATVSDLAKWSAGAALFGAATVAAATDLGSLPAWLNAHPPLGNPALGGGGGSSSSCSSSSCSSSSCSSSSSSCGSSGCGGCGGGS